MKENAEPTNQEIQAEKEKSVQPGPISKLLNGASLDHTIKNVDSLGIEIIKVKPDLLVKVISFLKINGFNYLQCQGGYDEGPGLNIVCFYHLISLEDFTNNSKPREVRIKVFLDRKGDLKVPSLYKIFRGSDWQERETFDMFGINFIGHPHPKRLLMPEDWKGWPLRKDYVQPDFYEMQDAY